MSDPMPATRRGVGQKIALGFAYFSLLMAAVSTGCTIYMGYSRDVEDVLFAALLAATAFFICVFIVLYVIGKANLPNLSLKDPSGRP